MTPYDTLYDPRLLSAQDIPVIEDLKLEQIPNGVIQRFWLRIITDGMGIPVSIPIFVAKGSMPGPVLGLTAAVHGNEINGIPVIQRLFTEIQPDQLRGSVIGVPVVNVPAVLLRQRRFFEEFDLNTSMPGKEGGNVAQVYAFRIVSRLLRHFNYLLDLHTAGAGQENGYYVRADLTDPIVRKMAFLQNAPIIVHTHPVQGSLRHVAQSMGIHCIALEVGNPQSFQRGGIRTGLTGIHNLLHALNMVDGTIDPPLQPPVICQNAYWIFSDTGGFLTVYPDIGDPIEQGQHVASIRNIFGDLIKAYYAPEKGILIGKSVDPVNQTGGKILHLGTPS